VPGAPWVSWHDLGDTPPATAVTTHAGGRPSTWLCLASRSRTAVGEKVFGSVAGRILGDATAPVVVVGPRAEAPAAFTRVVACVDRSPAAPRVVAAAVDLADRLAARLVVVEVSIPDVVGDPLEDDRHLRTLVRHLGRHATTVVLSGHRTWVPILDFVKDDPGTVLVTGRRPPTAAGRFVFGSVAVNLARKARGPVMIVPNPHQAA
jgi:nucleotide-binding universal stress UspA family protein